MNKLALFYLFLVSFGGHTLYLHDDAPKEPVSVSSAEVVEEAKQFCRWIGKTVNSVSKLIGFSTLLGSDELEHECLERRSSENYQIL